MKKRDEILKAIAEGLDLEESKLNINSKSSDFLEWDSLGHLTLLLKLDEKFNKVTEKFPELASSNSVLDIVNIIEKFYED